MNIRNFLNLKGGIYQKCMTNIIFNATIRRNHCDVRNKAKILTLTVGFKSKFEVRVGTGTQWKEIKVRIVFKKELP